MDQKQRLELAQVLKLSPSLLQSMGILQMTTLELADYLNDLALENPVMEEAPPGEETLGPGFPVFLSVIARQSADWRGDPPSGSTGNGA